MTEIDFFGHAFYAFMALGTYYLGKKDINGWWLRMFGNAGWIVLGFNLGLSSIWFWEIIFLVLAWQAYKEWKRQEEPVVEEAKENPKIEYTKFGLPYVKGSLEHHNEWMRRFEKGL